MNSLGQYQREILRIASERGTVTGHDVARPANVPANALGPVWSDLHRRGFIAPSGGAVRSQSPTRNKSITAVWRILDRKKLLGFLRRNPTPPEANNGTLFDSLNTNTPNKNPVR